MELTLDELKILQDSLDAWVGVDTTVGVLYGAFLSQEFPEWWERFASVPKLRQLVNESGVDVDGMRQECLDAFIDPKPQAKQERTAHQWRN